MQYTLRKVPAPVDRALRERARRDGQSLNTVALEALRSALGVEAETTRKRDLGDVAGTWVADRAVDRALTDQRKVDEDLWE